MPPKFLMRNIREPLPGKGFEVVDAVLEARKNSQLQSGVSMSIFSPIPRVITSTPFDDMASIEGPVEAVMSSPERQASFDAIAALCRSTRITLSRIIAQPEGLENAKWLQRYVFHHDTQSRRQLVAALQEFREHSEGKKMSITASLAGPVIISTLAAESLSEIEDAGDRLQNDPGTQARAAAILNATTDWSSGIAKVMT